MKVEISLDLLLKIVAHLAGIYQKYGVSDSNTLINDIRNQVKEVK